MEKNKIVEAVVLDGSGQPPNTPPKRKPSEVNSLYRVVADTKDPRKWCVLLLPTAGDWAGIIYSYGEFSIIEPKNEGDNPTFNFETDVIYVPDKLKGVEFPDEREIELRTLLGKILFDVIESYGDKSKIVDGKLFLDI